MKRFKINNKNYFFCWDINDNETKEMQKKDLNETICYIKQNTILFDIAKNIYDNDELLEKMALNNYYKKYFKTINKLIKNGSFYELGVNIEKYTDLYVMKLSNFDVLYSDEREKIGAFKIDKDFDNWTNDGFIAVKKNDFKNNKEKAYKYMQELIEKYKKVDRHYFKVEVYNDNEEYTDIMNYDTFFSFKTDEEKIKYILEKTAKKVIV